MGRLRLSWGVPGRSFVHFVLLRLASSFFFAAAPSLRSHFLFGSSGSQRVSPSEMDESPSLSGEGTDPVVRSDESPSHEGGHPWVFPQILRFESPSLAGEGTPGGLRADSPMR